MKKIIHNRYLQFLALALLLILVPSLAGLGLIPKAYIVLFGGMIIYSIVALGLNILMGYAGLISLGTAGFMGLAAYIAAYLSVDLKLSFLPSLLLAIILPTLAGVIVGFISLRIEGMYLAIATLVVSEIFRKSFEQVDFLTGGFSGKNAKYPRLFFGAVSLDREYTYYLLVFFLFLVMVLMYNLMNGQIGRAFNAMRGSEAAAQAMGVSLLKYRVLAFVIATAFASLGGALYIYFINFSYPAIWVLGLSLNILAVIVIGGLRSIFGTILGATIVFVIPDILLKQITFLKEVDGLTYIFNGILIILVILFYPNGVAHVASDFKRIFAYFKARKLGETND